MPDVTRDQALAAARLVYGAVAVVTGPDTRSVLFNPQRPCRAVAGVRMTDASDPWPWRDAASLTELVEELAATYAHACATAAEPWFAAGGHCSAAAMLDDDLDLDAAMHAARTIGHRLARLQVWVDDAKERVYRAAGLPERPSS